MNYTIGLLCVIRNEEKRIKKFLEHHGDYFDEIVIVDQNSTDKTLDRIGDYFNEHSKTKLTTIKDENYGHCEPSRQKGNTALSTDWVIYLDPDEELPVSFLAKMSLYINKPNVYMYGFKRENIFNVQVYSDDMIVEPKWLTVKHPVIEYQNRFYKKDKARFSSKLHSFIHVEDEPKTIKKLDVTIKHEKEIGEHWQDLLRYHKVKSKK